MDVDLWLIKIRNERIDTLWLPGVCKTDVNGVHCKRQIRALNNKLLYFNHLLNSFYMARLNISYNILYTVDVK